MPNTLAEPRKELLEKMLRGAVLPGTNSRIPRYSGGAEAPISYGQQQVWLHSQYSTEVALYNEPVTVHRLGPLDRTALERAFTEIVKRHEAWRTTFGWKGSELMQRVQPAPAHIDIPFVDVSVLSVNMREEEAQRVATVDAIAPFDLATGPMYRLCLVRFSEEEHRLYLTLHHIIFDGVSLYQVFLPELQTLYEAFSQGTPSPLEPLTLQYRDYAVWHRQCVEKIALKQMVYWREKLKDVVRRDILPTDYPRTKDPDFRGAMETLALDPQTSLALKDLSQKTGVTLFMTLLATFHTLIWAHTREEDIVSGGTSAGRHRSELNGLMGFFLNTIVLRTSLSGDPTFLELIQRGKDELLNSLENDGLPFEMLVKELAPRRMGGENPFFQVSFSFEPTLAPLSPNWRFTQMDIETGAAKFDLHLELDERREGIIGRFIYSAVLFKQKTIESMLQTWFDIVQRAIADPSQRISAMVPDLAALRRVPEKAFMNEPPSITSVATAYQKSKDLLRLVRERVWRG